MGNVRSHRNWSSLTEPSPIWLFVSLNLVRCPVRIDRLGSAGMLLPARSDGSHANECLSNAGKLDLGGAAHWNREALDVSGDGRPQELQVEAHRDGVRAGLLPVDAGDAGDDGAVVDREFAATGDGAVGEQRSARVEPLPEVSDGEGVDGRYCGAGG